VVAVKGAVGLEVIVGVGLDAAVISVGGEVSVGCDVSVAGLVLGESCVAVGRLVLASSGRDNFTPPSESARRKPPTTITHERKAAVMPITIPVTNRPWF
jgi:hypothetical protein